MVGGIHHNKPSPLWFLLIASPACSYAGLQQLWLHLAFKLLQLYSGVQATFLLESATIIPFGASASLKSCDNRVFLSFGSLTGWRKYCLYISNSSVNGLPALDLEGGPAKNLGQAKKASHPQLHFLRIRLQCLLNLVMLNPQCHHSVLR